MIFSSQDQLWKQGALTARDFLWFAAEVYGGYGGQSRLDFYYCVHPKRQIGSEFTYRVPLLEP